MWHLASLFHSHQIDQFGIILEVIIVHLHQNCGPSKPWTFLDAPMDFLMNDNEQFFSIMDELWVSWMNPISNY